MFLSNHATVPKPVIVTYKKISKKYSINITETAEDIKIWRGPGAGGGGGGSKKRRSFDVTGLVSISEKIWVRIEGELEIWVGGEGELGMQFPPCPPLSSTGPFNKNAHW